MSDNTPITQASIAAGLLPTAAISGRVIDEALVASWVFVLIQGVAEEGLVAITEGEFRRALRKHLLSSRFPVMPSDIWEHVRTERKAASLRTAMLEGDVDTLRRELGR